jgi:23S rRNA (uracil1939-C5)-methyltransferase
MRKSERIVPISACPVATEGINAMIPALGRSGATLVDSGTRGFRSDRDGIGEYEIDGHLFRFASSGFAQSNRGLLSPLGTRLRDVVRTPRVIDLYAGAGLLPFLLLIPGNDPSPVEEIVCVEPDRRNTPFITNNIGRFGSAVGLAVVTDTAEGWLAGIRRGRKVQGARAKGAPVKSGPAKGGLAKGVPAGAARERTATETPVEHSTAAFTGVGLTVLLDPPRGGIHPAVRTALADRGADAPDIVYLSCDSAALARDLNALVPRYRIDSIVLIDFFPQTAHIETLVVLRPRGAGETGEGSTPGESSLRIGAGR